MKKGSIRLIHEMNKISELITIQRDAWNSSDIYIIPPSIFKITADLLKPNGLVLGYFLDERIVGFIMTLPTSNPKEVLAHIGAVIPKYQNKGIFFELMLELRKIMRFNNVDIIFGTYDPLESINAHLYIKKLGGIITRYYIDYYGSINSKIHSGLPSDRFRVEWNIKDESVEKRIQSGMKGYYRKDMNYTFNSNNNIRYVEIPLNIQEVKNKDLNKAMEWRLKTRKLFYEYIEKQNFIGIDFIYDRINQKGKYVLKKLNK